MPDVELSLVLFLVMPPTSDEEFSLVIPPTFVVSPYTVSLYFTLEDIGINSFSSEKHPQELII